MFTPDDTDLRILRTLQGDGSLSASAVAERVGLSQSPCWRRISNLEEAGIIRGRNIVLDRKLLGFGTVVFVRVRLTEHGRQVLDEFATAAMAIREVQVVQLLLGEIDFRLKVVVRDLDHYSELLRDKFVNLPGVQELQSSVLLEEMKNTPALPI